MLHGVAEAVAAFEINQSVESIVRVLGVGAVAVVDVGALSVGVVGDAVDIAAAVRPLGAVDRKQIAAPAVGVVHLLAVGVEQGAHTSPGVVGVFRMEDNHIGAVGDGDVAVFVHQVPQRVVPQLATARAVGD